MARGQQWTDLSSQLSVPLSTALLLTDGTVMAQMPQTGHWWRLFPDGTGSYINGSWAQMADMPAGYGPLYYASAVLPDGRLVVMGGEFNLNSQTQVEMNSGAIYDPASNTWTPINPPPGATAIGDAASVVLRNGTLMIGGCCSATQYLLNASNLTWTATGSNKADGNEEEGWTLLPNGLVLTVDTQNIFNPGFNSEIYNPSTGSWSPAGSTGVLLIAGTEVGPAVLRPDGTVFATGANSNTAIYNTTTGQWSAGPQFPYPLGVPDGPAALLPNGNVLVEASPLGGGSGQQFFEFDGANLSPAPYPTFMPAEPAFYGRMLVLPTGQVLLTDGLTAVRVYTPGGTYQSAWQPTVSSVAFNLTPGSTNNLILGTQFNGLSQGAAYGDDAQSATNYPLVRITQNTTGAVTYAKTHNHSTMAVATGSAAVSTLFDIPSNIPPGASTLQVVANGIPSNGVAVNLTGPPDFSFAVSDPQTVDGSLTNSATFTFKVGFENGLGGTVNVSLDNTRSPDVASLYFSQSSFTSSGSGTFTFIFPSGTTGDYAIFLNATDGGITHSVYATLSITQPPLPPQPNGN